MIVLHFYKKNSIKILISNKVLFTLFKIPLIEFYNLVKKKINMTKKIWKMTFLLVIY